MNEEYNYLPHSHNIFLSLEEFTHNVFLGWNTMKFTISSTPVVHYLLPSLLIQMSGFIEQKYDSILWDIGYMKYENRYDLMKEYRIGSIELKTIKQFYNQVLKKYDQVFNENKEKYSLTATIAKEYTNISTVLLDTLSLSSIYPETAYLASFHKRKISENSVPILVEETVKYRNMIAHFKGFYEVSHYISFTGEQYKGINLIDSYCVLIALDKVFTDAFKSYAKNSHLYY